MLYTMPTKLSEKEAIIAKEKLKGKTDREIAAIVYPNSKPDTARVSVNRAKNKSHVKKYIEQTKLQAIKQAGVTWRDILQVRVDALKANKVAQVAGDFYQTEVPDHAIRMKAASDIERMLEKQDVDPDDKSIIDNLPEGIDEVHLARIIKSK